jgi:hypothetical protein
MKIFDYLYYKIYRASLLGSTQDIAGFVARLYLAGLIFLNCCAISIFLRKLNLSPLLVRNKMEVGVAMTCLFAITNFLFLYKNRYKRIISKYEQEDIHQRKKGNLGVWLYVIISFIFLTASVYYKQGQL